MKKLNYILGLIAIIAFVACSEEGFTTFDGRVSGIYIQRTASYSMNSQGQISSYIYSDSLEVSFANSTEDVEEMTANVVVKIMGNTADYDRPFVLKVDEANSTAEFNKDFTFNESDCVIKAGEAQTNVPITLMRSDILKEKALHIEFYLESNENFTTELEQYKNTNVWSATGDTLCGTRFKINFSDIYTIPFYWEVMCADVDLLGTWSVKKEVMVNELMGWTHGDWDSGKVTSGLLTYASKLMQKKLQEAADNNEPVLEDDGTYMQLGSGYEVDYSDYVEL